LNDYSHSSTSKCFPSLETQSTAYSVPTKNSWIIRLLLINPNTFFAPRNLSIAAITSISFLHKETPSDAADSRGLTITGYFNSVRMKFKASDEFDTMLCFIPLNPLDFIFSCISYLFLLCELKLISFAYGSFKWSQIMS